MHLHQTILCCLYVAPTPDSLRSQLSCTCDTLVSYSNLSILAQLAPSECITHDLRYVQAAVPIQIPDLRYSHDIKMHWQVQDILAG
jgi:hypothetical protein